MNSLLTQVLTLVLYFILSTSNVSAQECNFLDKRQKEVVGTDIEINNLCKNFKDNYRNAAEISKISADSITRDFFKVNKKTLSQAKIKENLTASNESFLGISKIKSNSKKLFTLYFIIILKIMFAMSGYFLLKIVLELGFFSTPFEYYPKLRATIMTSCGIFFFLLLPFLDLGILRFDSIKETLTLGFKALLVFSTSSTAIIIFLILLVRNGVRKQMTRASLDSFISSNSSLNNSLLNEMYYSDGFENINQKHTCSICGNNTSNYCTLCHSIVCSQNCLDIHNNNKHTEICDICHQKTNNQCGLCGTPVCQGRCNSLHSTEEHGETCNYCRKKIMKWIEEAGTRRIYCSPKCLNDHRRYRN